MSKTPVLGAGTNFTRTNAQGNGYIASFITDAGDPSLLNIPGGNWNLEFYFQSSASGGSPQFYAELYKVDASNNFTLVGSGSTNPEGITNGTTIDQYFTSIPVPQTSLLVTDRLSIRIYVIPAGRTITLHTENSNLCEVLTTFSTGLNALNGLTAQVQYFATGTSGTDFAISSATDTHTFNLPTASATNRGALSSADWSTFSGKVGGSGATGQVAYWNGTNSQTGSNNLFWDAANARLGIGTNAPSTTLDIRGKTRIQSSGNAELDIIDGSNSLRLAMGSTQGFVGTLSSHPFGFFTGALKRGEFSTNGNFILQNGGTFTDAGFRLDVNGTARVSGASAFGGDLTVGNSLSVLYNLANSEVALFQRSGSYGEVIRLGRAGVSNSTTINYPADATFAVSTAGAECMRITSGGNLLVGTTTDAGFKLDVNGTARVSGNMDFGTTAGASTITLPQTSGYTDFIVTNNATASTGIRFRNSAGTRVITIGGSNMDLSVVNGNLNAGTATIGNLSLGSISSSTIRGFNTATLDLNGDNVLLYSRTGTASPVRILSGSSSATSKGTVYISDYSNVAGTINASAQLQVDSTVQGFLPPRMTNAQRTAISSPAVGLMVYCTDATEGLYQYINNAWVNLTGVVTNRQTASYTLALGDSNDLVEMNVATANNLTVPLNSSVAFPIGTKIDIAQYGAGQTTVVATSGVTVRSAGGALKLSVQYSGASLVKIATDEWYLFGDITV
jgi:hypothetical protein